MLVNCMLCSQITAIRGPLSRAYMHGIPGSDVGMTLGTSAGVRQQERETVHTIDTDGFPNILHQ